MITRTRTRWLCLDCGVHTGHIAEHYVLADEVWFQVAPKEGMLCIGCLESRLGRQLAPADFAICYVNSNRFAARSARLTDRLYTPNAYCLTRLPNQ